MGGFPKQSLGMSLYTIYGVPSALAYIKLLSSDYRKRSSVVTKLLGKCPIISTDIKTQ